MSGDVSVASDRRTIRSAAHAGLCFLNCHQHAIKGTAKPVPIKANDLTAKVRLFFQEKGKWPYGS
ncbi:hypothetical protein CERSUDRAFT_85150 [Gelatoporia subvermispora B]|uniref:Uncharacterized protein n=1 Tax=Ceriporiopsis subvermispora (strain B) TaxID=914234 RepID=M2PIR4_CERS8|nr:hypothetical protein CERSUDRAFT_85150 [Gelatoporia subvermispora B]